MPTNFGDQLEKVLSTTVRVRLTQIVREEADGACVRVRQRMADEIDGLALSVLKSYDLRQCEDRLVITVNRKNLEETSDAR